MAQGDVLVTFAGNLVEDPELRFTTSSVAVLKFRVACNSRHLDKEKNEWVDDDPTFISCQVWRNVAENGAESLKQGSRVVVTGRLRQRSYETKEGEKRSVYEVQVDELAVSLRGVSVVATKKTSLRDVSGFEVLDGDEESA